MDTNVNASLEYGSINDQTGELTSHASYYNYLIPAVALGLWATSFIGGISYIGMITHNSQYPNNPVSSDWIDMTGDFAKYTAVAGAGMIGPAIFATLGRSLFAGGCSAIKNSFTKLGEPEGIIVNTLVAPFLGCYFAVACLGRR